MSVRSWLGWALLVVLLVSLLIAAAADRGSAAAPAAGEATYLMQAESLARDFDLSYTRVDFDRMLLRWNAGPGDLALTSGSHGQRIAFDRPFPYALWLAPFVGRWPKAGAAVANALLLALTALLAARALRLRAGGWAPSWVTAMVFASAVFAFVVPATGEIFLLAATVAGLSLLVEPPPTAAGGCKRGLIAGALLAVPVATDGLYALLLAAALWMPAAAAAPACCRAAVRRGLLLGAAATLAAIVSVHWLAGGGLPFTASGFQFTAATGYPLVDFTSAEWTATVRHLEAGTAGARFRWDPELRVWSSVDLLAGRAIGLVPNFAPLLLLAAGGSSRGFRRPIVAAAVAWVVAVVVLRPFDVAGGPAGIANPLFVPFYGALWLVLDRRRPPWRLAVGTVATLLVAALFLGELWPYPGLAAAAGDVGRGDESAARRWLPFETSQRWRLGGPAVEHGGLKVEAIGAAAWVELRRRRVVFEGSNAELLISAPAAVAALRIDFEGPGAEQLRVRGARIEPAEGPRGRSAKLVLGGLHRRHSSSWSRTRLHRYVLSLELPPPAGPLAMRLSVAGER